MASMNSQQTPVDEVGTVHYAPSVAFLGPLGTYTHQVSCIVEGGDWRLSSFVVGRVQ